MTNYYNKDFYKVLNVSIDASVEDIKAAYKKLVKTCHPDITGKEEDIEKFKEIQKAYEVLSDENKRKKYDVVNGYFREKVKRSYEKAKNNKNLYEEVIKKAKENSKKSESFSHSINEALDNLFNTKKTVKSKEEKKSPKNGEDINVDITLSCFEALKGTNRKVNILHTEPCPNCQSRMFINASICPMCNGTGQISTQKKINVKIPKGVTQGSRVRIKKEGNKGINGGKDGDLYLIVNIEKNKYFDIEGLDILCNLPVTPYEAALGTVLPIKIIDNTYNVNIPPLSSSGQKLKLAGLGLDNKAKTKKGDLIITLVIKMPHSISQKEKELYSQLKDIDNNNIRSDMYNG